MDGYSWVGKWFDTSYTSRQFAICMFRADALCRMTHTGCGSGKSVTLSARSTRVLYSSISWDIKPCRPLKVNRSFRGTCRLLLSKKPACIRQQTGNDFQRCIPGDRTFRSHSCENSTYVILTSPVFYHSNIWIIGSNSTQAPIYVCVSSVFILPV
jgi:hypothetical protein